MNEPSPIRGRWTIFLDTFARAFDVEDGVSPHAGTTSTDGSQAVEVVPVPDEQAIERAAQRLWDDEEASTESVDRSYRVKSWSDAHDLDHAEYLSRARAVLAAALEQPE